MTIRVIDSAFESIAQDGDFQSVDQAFNAALTAGVHIAAEQVLEGVPVATVEVAVDLVGQKCAAVGVVSISTARLQPVAG